MDKIFVDKKLLDGANVNVAPEGANAMIACTLALIILGIIVFVTELIPMLALTH